MDMENFPNVYYWDPTNPLSSTKTCVAQCPNLNTIPTRIEDAVCLYSFSLESASLNDLATAMNNGSCSPYIYKTISKFSYCLPSGGMVNFTEIGGNYGSSNSTVSQSSILDSGRDYFQATMHDVAAAWQYLLGGAGAAVLLNFMWTLLLRYFAGAFVWLSAFLASAALDAMAVYMYLYWQRTKDNYDDLTTENRTQEMKWEVDASLGVFIAVLVIAVILQVILIFMRYVTSTGITLI